MQESPSSLIEQGSSMPMWFQSVRGLMVFIGYYRVLPWGRLAKSSDLDQIKMLVAGFGETGLEPSRMGFFTNAF